MAIHRTAEIHPGAEIAPDVEIGAFTLVGEGVRIGAGTRIMHHCSILGPTEIGRENHVFPHASLGTAPQDISYRGEDTRLVVGDRNIFRESVTVNRGTPKGGGLTRIGSDNYFMAYSHVAHDCDVGNHVIMANCASLGGHIRIDDHAILGGLAAVHQFVRIGRITMIGGLSGVALDVPPFMIASGQRAELYGLNVIGLRRHGFTASRLAGLKKAFKIIFRSGLILKKALERTLEEVPDHDEVRELVNFMQGSERGVCRPPAK